MIGVVANTALSMFTTSGSTISTNLRDQVLKALRYGSCTAPTRWFFNGFYVPYSGSEVPVNSRPGPSITSFGNSYHWAFWQSPTESIADWGYPGASGYMSSGDSFRFTQLTLTAGSTAYAIAPVNVTVPYGSDFYIRHSVKVITSGASNYHSDSASDYAAAQAIATGQCNAITGMKYRLTNSSTNYDATSFSWGTGSAEYQATAIGDTGSLSQYSPSSVMLANGNTIYATQTPSGSHTLGNRVIFTFNVLGTY